MFSLCIMKRYSMLSPYFKNTIVHCSAFSKLGKLVIFFNPKSRDFLQMVGLNNQHDW